ncbi:MAG: PEGA domain-containing protein [Proteobacteria bacterium]|nr:PEGA domain-containing protein [Pseudomonadota bacterium]MCP4915679.1 PEGA domain-containing protein [Pseudomonadota bacterium]
MWLALVQTLFASPLLVRAAVVIEADEQLSSTTVARSRTDLVALLEGSGRYQVLSPELAEGRLGHDPAGLPARCLEDEVCWVEAGRSLGVDQLVVVSLFPDWVGPRATIRVVDVNAEEPIRQLETHLPRNGGAPVDHAQALFFGPGKLVLDVSPAPYELELDGHRYGKVAGEHVVDPLAAGKHVVRVGAEGHTPQFAAVMVYPDGETRVDILLTQPPPPPHVRVRWGPWAASSLVAGAAVVLLVTRNTPGTAF